MGLNSKSEKRGADISSFDEGENEERSIKRLKLLENKGTLNSLVADEYKGPSSPVPFLSSDGHVTKPAEIFRTDLISAMKLPDTQMLNPESYMTIMDPWRQEWERGVQVPVHPERLSQPSFTVVDAPKKATNFKLGGKLLNSEEKRKSKTPCNYDLNRIDVEWLANLNKSRQAKGRQELEECILEKAISYLEDKCYENLGYAIVTQEGLSIEYDESVCCDVCQSPDSEEGNEMVFCDSCDICVHQACYGIQHIPSGSWLCQPCTRAVTKPPCLLCSNPGGAMKRTKKGKHWVHVSCALWVPEVGFGCVERMEPIVKIQSIPVKTCMTAFHVTCGIKNGLDMKTILDDTAVDGVRHISYCAKHGHKNKSPSKTPEKIKQDAEDAENQRQKKLKQMETEFYKFVDIGELAKDLNITKELATRIHAYWTLKRKARDDVPLLPPTLEQQEKLCGKQGAASRTLQIQIEELMKIRCDLERLRNLCYMVSKREKLRRELYRIREQVFWQANETVTQDGVDDSDVQWIKEACGKNFSSDGSLPPSMPTFDVAVEPVSTIAVPTCGTDNTEELRTDNGPTDCYEDKIKGGYDSSDSDDSPRIKTRRLSRGVGRPRKQIGNRVVSDSSDSQPTNRVNKSNDAKDGSQKTSEDPQNTTPRRSLRFNKMTSFDNDTHDEPNDTTTHDTPKTRELTTSDHLEDLELLRDSPPPPSPNRMLRSVNKSDPSKRRSNSTGEVEQAITPRRTRSSLSQSDDHLVKQLSLDGNSPQNVGVSLDENVLKENNKTRSGRIRTLSEKDVSSQDEIPGKRAKLGVKRRYLGKRKKSEESDQARITQYFMKRSPRQKLPIKSPKAKFLNGYKSPKCAKSTESDSTKSDEENSEHRVERLSTLRSFNADCVSPCRKCPVQNNHKRCNSKSPECKNKGLRASNMQSPRSRLVPSLRCYPSRSCNKTMSPVSSVVS